MKFHIASFCLVASSFSTAAQNQSQIPAKPVAKQQVVTAARANGVYRFDRSEFRILALGNNKLKVQFDGVYVNIVKSVNVGYAAGEATIAGNLATFIPPDTERCKITLLFLANNKLRVTQEGSDFDCGFGHNVYATGTYRKVRGGKPKFESPP